MVRPHLDYAVQTSTLILRKTSSWLKRMQQLATSEEFQKTTVSRTSLRTQTSLDGAILSSLTTVYKLYYSYLSLSVEEFFESPAAGYFRGHSFKVRRPRFHLDRRRAAFAILSAGPWDRLPPHIAEARTVSSFMDRLNANWRSIFPDIVWPYPIHWSYANGFGTQVLSFRPVNLSWSDLTADTLAKLRVV